MDREIICKYYIAETLCCHDKEGTFYDKCQTCELYEPYYDKYNNPLYYYD